jgi:hypothetical protein
VGSYPYPAPQAPGLVGIKGALLAAEPYTAGRIGAWWGIGFSNQPKATRAVTVSAEYKRLEVISLKIFMCLEKGAAVRPGEKVSRRQNSALPLGNALTIIA